MLAYAQTLRNLCYRIATFNNLGHRVALELLGEVASTYHSLLASNLGKKASTNLGAIQIDFTWKDYLRLMTRDASVSIPGAEKVFARLKEIDLPVVSDRLSDHVDTRIIDGLKRDGFITGLQKQYGVN
jgi:hypothetical protein